MFWPQMKDMTRYQSSIKIFSNSFGDLAAAQNDKTLRETRDETFETDERGFPNTQGSSKKQLDLLVLGDSFAAGTSTSQEKTWFQLLKKDLQINAYNLSIPGSPWTEYVNLYTEGKELRFKEGGSLVWMLFPGNDLDEKYNSIEWMELPWNGPIQRFFQSAINYYKRWTVTWKLLGLITNGRYRSSNLVIKSKIHDKRVLFFKTYTQNGSRSIMQIKEKNEFGKLVKIIHKVNDFAQQRHLALIIVIAPSKEEVYRWAWDKDYSRANDFQNSSFYMAIKPVCQELDIRVVDLKPSIALEAERRLAQTSDLLYWTDDTHWNEYGHEFVFQLMRKILKGETL